MASSMGEFTRGPCTEEGEPEQGGGHPEVSTSGEPKRARDRAGTRTREGGVCRGHQLGALVRQGERQKLTG